MNKRKSLLFSLLLLHGVITGYFWYLNPGQNFADNSGATLLALGSLSGLILASLALLQVLLMSRGVILEQTWGLDKLSRAHATLGKMFLVFLLLHPALVVAAYANWSQVSFFNQYLNTLQLDDIPQAVASYWLFIVLIIYSLLRVYKKLEFEKWYLSHLLMYGAVILAFGHQLELGSSLNTNNLFSAYWVFVFALVFAYLAWYRFGLPAYRTYKHRFFVAKVLPDTNGVWSVYIKGQNLNTYSYQAGQFVIARFLVKPFFWQAHPFTMSTEPNGEYLRLTIKALGDFTSTLKQLQVGTKVYLEGPYGIFTAQKAKKDKVLLLAGGIGITPIRALLPDLVKMGKQATLVYGSKTEADIALRSEIEELASKYKFQVHYVLSNAVESANPNLEAPNTTQTPTAIDQNAKPTFHYGFVDIDLLSKLVPDFLKREVFLCGPPAMMDGLLTTLKENGLPQTQLHFERFSL